MGSGDHGDGQVLQVSISAFWVSGAPGFDQRLQWLFGAGASVSGQIPTSSQIVLDLLFRLYAGFRHLVHQDLNLGDEMTRQSFLAYSTI